MTTMEELAARVARLEGDVDGIRELRLDVGLQAQAYGLGLVHTDTQALRADVTVLRGDMTQVRGDITELRSDMTQVRGDITEVKRLLTDLVSRPEPPQ